MCEYILIYLCISVYVCIYMYVYIHNVKFCLRKLISYFRITSDLFLSVYDLVSWLLRISITTQIK